MSWSLKEVFMERIIPLGQFFAALAILVLALAIISKVTFV